MIIVQLCSFGRDGDTLYRIHEPARALANLPGTAVVDAHLSGRYGFELARRADLLVLQFANDWGLADLVRERRSQGRPTVFEANDDFFDLQPWNPIAAAWADPSVPALYRHLLRSVDGVQTSTAHLAARWQAMGADEVAVFDNDLAEAPPPLKPLRAEPLTIGWAGSPGHFADLYWIAPALQRWLDAHLETQFSIMTAEPARAFFDLSPERYRFVPFGSREDYLAFLDTLDIGLAPLLPSDYNRGRSDVKHLEYASRGVAGLYSNLEPYRGRVRPEETGLLFRDPCELVAGLDRLAGDEPLRSRIREGAYRAAQEGRRLQNHVGLRLAWYEELARRAGAMRGAGLRFVAGYHAVDLASGEAGLRDQPPPPAMLDALLADEPGHRTAALLRAKSHLAARDATAALGVLRSALGFEPSDSMLRAEFGRALFVAGDAEGARRQLDAVLIDEPASFPVWHYRLRLALVTGEAKAPTLGLRALRALPANGVLALLAAALLPTEMRTEIIEGALTEFAPALGPIERESFVDALVEVLVGTWEADEARRLKLLEASVAEFPESGVLARLFGRSLRRKGADRKGWMEEARAAHLPPSQGPREGESLTDLLALHILRHAPGDPN